MTAPAALVAQADLEQRFSPLRVLEFADDQHSGDSTNATVQANVAAALLEATHVVIALFNDAWTVQQITNLSVDDQAIRGAICDVGMDILSRRRTEFLDKDGESIFASKRRAAERLIEKYSQREMMPVNAPQTGQNRTIGTNHNRDFSNLIFQGSKEFPRGRGGF